MIPLLSKSKTISLDFWEKLQQYPRGSDLTWPASVKTYNGNYYPCVLFLTKQIYRKHFIGCYGDEKDPVINLDSVASIDPSPYKMPVKIERQMYKHGETHMGGYVVILILNDGTKYWHSSGDFLEFVSVPEGYKSSDVVDVVFPKREEYKKDHKKMINLSSPDWKWCFFKKPP